MNEPEKWQITFELVGGAYWQHIPGEVRVRRLLKSALRVFGLRCAGIVSVREAPAEPPVPAKEAR